MRVHWLQHVPFEGLGSIAPWLAARGAEVTCTRLWAGDALPAAPDHDWLIAMGGPMNVDEEDRLPWLGPEKAFVGAAIAAGRTVLGICLGAQLVARALGAAVRRNAEVEIGWLPIHTVPGAERDPIAAALVEPGEVFHWHGDTFDLPPGARLLASSEGCANQAFAIGNRVIGTQFHLETTEQAARDLIDHCRDEIEAGGRYVQDEPEILREPERFTRVNAAMKRILDALAQARGA